MVRLTIAEAFQLLITQYSHAEQLLQSQIVTDFFKELSLLIAQVIPTKVTCYLLKLSAEARVLQIQEMMTDIIHILEKSDLKLFLTNYIKPSTLVPDDLQEDGLISYLIDEKGFHEHVKRATDVKNLIESLKKGVLRELYGQVQRFQSEVLDMMLKCCSLKQQLTKYEWICKLSSVQVKVRKLLEISRTRTLKSNELAEIGIDLVIEAHSSNDDIAKLLQHYALIECVPPKRNGHRVSKFKAANLSLKDLLSNPDLNFNQCDEICFLCTECFYIDASIDSTTDPSYAGKNFAIKAARVHVMGKHLLDVSGMEGLDGGKDKADSGQEPGAPGVDGKHGTPGQSGGNILIFSDEITTDSGELTLRSCGGNGGHGQDGGDGKDGISKASAEEDLSDCPKDFASVIGYKCGRDQREILAKLRGSGYCCPVDENEGNGAHYVYSEAPNGARLLFATVNDHYFLYLSRYGFLFSKSKDGMSADGGDAGKGGKAGAGGEEGSVEIISLQGYPINDHDDITVECSKGQDGKPGRTRNFGKRAIAERKYDHLRVDGAAWGKQEIYHKFIDMKSWENSSKSGELGRGKYYCRQGASRRMNSLIDSNHVGFFTACRDRQYPTKYNRKAVNGKSDEEQQVIATTKARSIDKAAINIDYELFANTGLNLQDHSAVLQALEQLEHRLHEELQELETAQEKQQHKQLRRAKYQLTTSSVADQNLKPISKDFLMEEATITFQTEKLMKLKENPLISEDLTEFLKEPIEAKYSKVKEIIQTHLEYLVKDDDPSLLKKFKNEKFCQYCTGDIYCLLDAVFVPIVQVMHFKHTHAIDGAVKLLDNVQHKSHSSFRDKMKQLRKSTDEILFKQYRWCVLADVYEKCISTIPHSDIKRQSVAAALYQKVHQLNTIKKLKKFASSLIKDETPPYSEPLPEYDTQCDATMSLSSSTLKGLELLMVFINEMNSCNVYLPDILRSVKEEYETFLHTINDTDLLFVMTYLQEKLLHFFDRTQLEELFYDDLLSRIKDHALKQQDCIVCNGTTFQIIQINCQPVSDAVVDVTMKANGMQAQSKIHILKVLSLDTVKVSLDGELIVFPSETLFVSPVDVNEVWNHLQQSVMKERRVAGDCVLKSLSLPRHVDEKYKYCLISMLRQARAAQDVPYDIFSFYPPSQWVKQLIIYTVQRYHLDQDPNFVDAVQEATSGLSRCPDNTVYFMFFNQFLISDDGHYSTADILEVVQALKSVFLDRKLCTLVTQQGIASTWPHLHSEAIFEDLQSTGLIDETGSFLPNVSLGTVQNYCKTRSLSPEDYLKNSYTMQQYHSSLINEELTFWTHKLHELSLHLDLQDVISGDTDDSMFAELTMYLQMLVRLYDKLTFSNFIDALKSKTMKTEPDILLNLLTKCASKEFIFDIVIDKLLQNASEPLALTLQYLQGFDWESEHDRTRTAIDIIACIKSQLPKNLTEKLDQISDKVDEIKAIENNRKRSQLPSLDLPPICDYSQVDIKYWAEEFRKSAARVKEDPFNHCLFAEAFAVIRRAIAIFYENEKGKKGITPRDTQMVASLLFFQNLCVQRGVTRLMQQISTGEGKTMIICMTAIFKALLGEKVDIVTSSSVLATRDAAEQKPLYSLFEVSVSHCCHEELTRRRQAYECDVIYGDIGNFQRDILETEFYNRMIRTSHGYDNVFIDEVDSMLVDKGETMLYLPHALPDLNALDQLFLEIWSLVNAKDFIGFPDEQEQLYNFLSQKIFGGLQVNAFTAVPNISEQQSADIHQSCIDVKLIDQDNHSLKTKNTTEMLYLVGKIKHNVLPPNLRQEVILIIQEHMEAVPFIEAVPKPLHPFVKKSLKAWIQSAVSAKYFRLNKEYIIDIDRRESAADRYPRIIIMDNETGVEQESSEWGSGLHQFLQLKHQLRISTESLKAVYMSNISFFTKRYVNIMGVTGTLGSTSEHSLFSKLYKDTRLVVLPTNKPSRLLINQPECYPTKEEWETAINADIQEKIDQGRSVLLICEDVEGARRLSRCFKEKHSLFELDLYISSHQQKLEEKGECQPGQLIIATNIAGRGTDIKLSEAVKKNGGLHVCLSYLPQNIRVEQQAYGRAARSGDPGSCRLIFFNEGDSLGYAIRKRDWSEAQRVAAIEADYYHNIQFQEDLFQMFTTEYKTIKEKHKEKPEGRPELDYCLDCWAYFLDRYTDQIESIPQKVTNEERAHEKNVIISAFAKEVKVAIERMELSPARLIQQGHLYMKQAVKRGDKYENIGNKVNYDEAIKCYQKSYDLNPGNPFAKYYEAAAQLNRVFHNKNTTLCKGKEDRRNLKQAFYKLIPVFENKVKQCQSHVVTLQIANRHQEQSLTGGINYFNEQKQHEVEVYQRYLESMQEIVGRPITSDAFDHVDWKESGAVFIYKFVKEIIPLKDYHVSKHYSHRLESLLKTESYHTFESKIRNRVQSLWGKMPVTKRDFEEGIFPDKHRFWDQLTCHHLITSEKTIKDDAMEHKVGYWNPEVDYQAVQFKYWDYICANSFDWISPLSANLREDLVDNLKGKGVLNSKGQLIDFNLSKPLNLPEMYTPYYKSIKDTLWEHSVYHFVLDHLHGCVIIDMERDIICDGTSSTSTHGLEQISEDSPDSNSVVNTIISMYQAANSSDATSYAHHLQHSSPENAADPEALNQIFLEQLHSYNLRVTKIHGDGINSLLYAIIQHAKREYQSPTFKEEADRICKELQLLDHSVTTSMSHTDDQHGEAILKLVNNHCTEKDGEIKIIHVVSASRNGPAVYARDERFPTGRQVVIWQQGTHYVSVVHHSDLIQVISQYQVSDLDELKASSVDAPKLTLQQLKKLIKVGAVKQNEEDKYCICAGLNRLEDAFKSMTLSAQDKAQVKKFVEFKLEVDFKTLSNSPRQLLCDHHQVLYDDLCKYAVIKPVKVRKNADHIEKACHYWFGKEKVILLDDGPQFDVEKLNAYLEHKSVKKLNKSEQESLVYFLEENMIIEEQLTVSIHRVIINKIQSAHSHLLHSIPFLDEAQRNGVADYLQLSTQLKQNVTTVISTLKSHQSTIREVETPEITLRRLYDVFEESIQDKWDVLEWFSDSQCDFIIDLAEQKWSWKTIFTAIGAIALGVAQIAVGAVLLIATAGTGSFFCNGLISEGVSDMIFGIEGLVKGHCNWSQYWDNKKMSIAITVATAGLGAIFARGKEASKYAYKAFGNASKKLMTQSAQYAGRSVSKVLAKEVAKKIAKKIGGAVLDAGINIATDAIVSQLSKAVGCMSEFIISLFDTMCQDKDLRSKMNDFIQQQDRQDAEKYLHQVTAGVLQRHSFLDLWDAIEDKAKTGANVLSQAHGQAASHLQMRSEKLKGKGFMKCVGVVTRFGPLITETVKSGLIKVRMEKVKKALKEELNKHAVAKQGSSPLDETQTRLIEGMVDKELAAMKQHFVQEMSQRGRKIVTTGLQLLSQEARKRMVAFAKEKFHSLKEFIDISQLERYERKITAAKSDRNQSQIQKYKRKMQKLLARTCSPKVFAHLIEHHDAELGPAYAIPALEKILNCPVKVVTEDGNELLNVGHEADGDAIVVKFLPGSGDHPGHYFHDGRAYTHDQHGNNCLIHAVLAGAGRSDLTVRDIRSSIAKACLDSRHPCNRYIKLGIARNYVQIGLAGGKSVYNPKDGKISGKAEWYPHMDSFLYQDWMKHPENARRSGIDLDQWKNGDANLKDLGLDRCHRVSEKSIQQMLEIAISKGDVETLKLLRKNLLPSLSEVESGESHFEGKAIKAFEDTYTENSVHRKDYSEQVRRVEKCIDKLKNLTGTSKVDAINQLAADLSNSPLNVSLGDASTNRSVGRSMDFNPGTPRSDGLYKAFKKIDGFIPYKLEGGGCQTSFFSGSSTIEEERQHQM